MLNILPTPVKNKAKLKQNYDLLKKVTLYFYLIIFLPIGLLIANYFFLQNVKTVQGDYKNIPIEENEDLSSIKQELNDFENTFKTAKEIQNNHINPAFLINEFIDSVPEGIKIKNLEISTTEKIIKISGLALNRDNLIELQNNLNENQTYIAFDYPVSNLAAKENINFDFTGKIKYEN